MKIESIDIFNGVNIFSSKKVACIKVEAGIENINELGEKIIEIQNILGYNLVNYYEVRNIDHEIYLIAEHDNLKIIKPIIYLAVDILEHRIEQAKIDEHLSKLKRYVIETEMPPNIRLLKNACLRRGIKFERIGYTPFSIVGEGKYAKLFYGTNASVDIFSYMICKDREALKWFLQSYGVNTPKWEIIYSREELEEKIKDIGFPIVLKGCSKSSSMFLNVRTLNQAKEFFDQIKKNDDRILLERYVQGNCYKILMINNNFIAAIKRIPPYIIGDGKTRIENMLKPKDKEDKNIARCILKQGFTLTDVLPKGIRLYLKEANNLKNGCIIEDVTATVNTFNQKMCSDIVQKLKLSVAVIDIICEDISLPMNITGGSIVDVDVEADLRVFQQYCNVDVFNEIIDMHFEKMSNPSVPTIVIAGKYGKTTLLRMIGYVLFRSGINVAATENIEYYNLRSLNNEADIGLIELPIIVPKLETDITSNIVCITNCSNEKKENIESLLLAIKMLKEDGFLILNAKDKHILSTIIPSRCNVILTSSDNNHSEIKDFILQKKQCVFLKDGEIVVFDKGNFYSICSVDEIPYSYNGKVQFAIENILQAVAVLYFYGVDIEIISRYLREYRNDSHQNPGKFNIFDINGIKICIDKICESENILNLKQALNQIGVKNIKYICSEEDKPLIKEGEEVYSTRIKSYSDILYLMHEAMKKAKKGDAILLILKEPFNIDITHEIRERLVNKKKQFI